MRQIPSHALLRALKGGWTGFKIKGLRRVAMVVGLKLLAWSEK